MNNVSLAFLFLTLCSIYTGCWADRSSYYYPQRPQNSSHPHYRPNHNITNHYYPQSTGLHSINSTNHYYPQGHNSNNKNYTNQYYPQSTGLNHYNNSTNHYYPRPSGHNSNNYTNHYYPQSTGLHSTNSSNHYYPHHSTGYNSTNRLYPDLQRFKRFGYYYPIHYNSSGHHIFLGYPGYRDRLLYNQSIEKSARWWSAREKIIEYPGYVPFGHVRNETITAIRVYDQGYYGHDGYARIIAGGIGYNFVKIRLYTIHWNRGFRFLVQIYGH